MSIRLMSQVWDSSPYEHSLLLVHLCLADISNDDGHCWPSVAWIAKKCRLDERYTRRLLNQMVDEGVVEKSLREGKKNTNVYLVRVTPVKKDTVNITQGEKDPLSPRPPVPLSPRPPNPSVNPSEVKTPKGRGTQTEVEDYCTSKDLKKTDGEWFFCKCEGNGWKNGKEPIKDWKMTVNSWKLQGYFPSQKVNGRPNGTATVSVPKINRLKDLD